MSMRDLISGEAELGSDEEEDQSFDEETGETRPRKLRAPVDMEDSSEEEEDDDDEEAARAVCQPQSHRSLPQFANICGRSEKASSSMKKTKNPRRESDDVRGTESVDALSARRRRLSWMKRTWI